MSRKKTLTRYQREAQDAAVRCVGLERVAALRAPSRPAPDPQAWAALQLCMWRDGTWRIALSMRVITHANEHLEFHDQLMAAFTLGAWPAARELARSVFDRIAAEGA